MQLNEYFQSYTDYFWQWEEQADVIAIPNESTIAYSQLVNETLDQLAPQGIPPFGSLLLAIIATNPKGSASLDAVNVILNSALKVDNNGVLADAITFLKLLSEVPEQYKKGKNRVLLFQAIFERCHNILSVTNSQLVANYFRVYKNEKSVFSVKAKFNLSVFAKDFRTVGLLKNKFPDVNSILSKIASLPDMTEVELLNDNSNTDEKETADFIEQLIANTKTFHVGSLVKRIWSGLNIPFHSALPSQQPLGGISDLTNKGDFDKLLVSEFANDDIIFLSRLANNEALYIQREIPPANNNLERIILIDISLKNWGTPKTIAFATMLAIAKHPKTTINCSAFALGNTYYPISIDNLDSIIEGVQLLEGSLNAAPGLSAFFKEYPSNKDKEVFLITEPSTLKQSSMLKAMTEYHSFINYWIYPDADGKIDIYKKQQSSKKHIQHILLPVKELWQKPDKNSLPAEERKDLNGGYPLLLRSSVNFKKIMSTSDGEVFQVASDKALFRHYGKSVKNYEKGWDVVYENLPVTTGEFEMGRLENGDYLLLMFNLQNKDLILLNINTGEKKTVPFNEGKPTAANTSTSAGFIFHDQSFYHRNNRGSWIISNSGIIEKVATLDVKLFEQRTNELVAASQNYSYTLGVLKNINEIFINEKNNLVFNIHELYINQGGHIKIDKSTAAIKSNTAKKENDNEFVFNDGSSIEVNRCGLLILKSSNRSIPDIYVPSVLESSIGLATKDIFAGNEYYYKKPQFELHLISDGNNRVSVIKVIKQFVDIGLGDIQELIEKAPVLLVSRVSHDAAIEFKKQLEEQGATAEIRPANSFGRQTFMMQKIATADFFKDYIQPFISTIQSYGTKD